MPIGSQIYYALSTYKTSLNSRYNLSHMFRKNGMSRSHGCERVTMFRTNVQVISLNITLTNYVHINVTT